MKSKTIFQAVCHLNLNHSISAESWKRIPNLATKWNYLQCFFKLTLILITNVKQWIYQILSEKSRTQVTESNLSWCESIFSLNPFERNPNPFEGNPNPNPFEVFESYKRYESESCGMQYPLNFCCLNIGGSWTKKDFEIFQNLNFFFQIFQNSNFYFSEISYFLKHLLSLGKHFELILPPKSSPSHRFCGIFDTFDTALDSPFNPFEAATH